MWYTSNNNLLLSAFCSSNKYKLDHNFGSKVLTEPFITPLSAMFKISFSVIKKDK